MSRKPKPKAKTAALAQNRPDVGEPRAGRQRLWMVALGLVIIVAVTYSRVQSNDFVNLDDNVLVVENPKVNVGLTSEGIVWAFSKIHHSNWAPLSWISHMIDCELFGLAARGHHLVNLGFHLANVMLLFLLIFRMTGRLWASATVAALFGLHPIHVESVAWIAERRDVLSTLFWLLTSHAYLTYVRTRRLGFYLLVCAGLGLGLMAKPMLVTLPFVLLLLDTGRSDVPPSATTNPRSGRAARVMRWAQSER